MRGDTRHDTFQDQNDVRRQEAIQRALNDLGRPALHAKVLGFKHPTSGETLKFESTIPPDFKRVKGELDSLYGKLAVAS